MTACPGPRGNSLGMSECGRRARRSPGPRSPAPSSVFPRNRVPRGGGDGGGQAGGAGGGGRVREGGRAPPAPPGNWGPALSAGRRAAGQDPLSPRAERPLGAGLAQTSRPRGETPLEQPPTPTPGGGTFSPGCLSPDVFHVASLQGSDLMGFLLTPQDHLPPSLRPFWGPSRLDPAARLLKAAPCLLGPGGCYPGRIARLGAWLKAASRRGVPGRAGVGSGTGVQAERGGAPPLRDALWGDKNYSPGRSQRNGSGSCEPAPA